MGKLLSGPTTLSLDSCSSFASKPSLFKAKEAQFPQPLPKHRDLQPPTFCQPSTEPAPVYQHLPHVWGPQTWMQISRCDPRNAKQSRSSTSLHVGAMLLPYNPACCWPPGPPRHTASSCSASLGAFPNFYGLSKNDSHGSCNGLSQLSHSRQIVSLGPMNVFVSTLKLSMTSSFFTTGSFLPRSLPNFLI